MPATLRPVLVLDTTPVGGITQTVPYTAARPFIIADFMAVSTADDGGSTATLWRGPGGGGLVQVSSACAFAAAAGTLGRTTAIAAAQVNVIATDLLSVIFTSGGANTLAGHAYTHLLPTPITGA